MGVLDKMKTKSSQIVDQLSGREKRRRLNKILEICKVRKDVKAVECFDSDCEGVKEEKLFSHSKRKRADGSMQVKETDTGNILVGCEIHEWKQLFSVSQLDNMPMPARATTVNEGSPIPAGSDGTILER